MRRSVIAIATLSLVATGCATGEVPNDGTTTEPSAAATAVADGLTCPSDVREAAEYDYDDDPEPHGAEPDAAVEQFFDDELPDDAMLSVNGSQVTVMIDQVAVASIGLMTVPDGYVIARYEACQGVLT